MLLLLALLCRGVAAAQSVQRARWWLDNEPQPVTSVTSFASIDVSLEELQPGLHTFSTMVQDDEGHWSHAVSHYFVLVSSDDVASHSLARCQYWIDSDFAGAKMSNVAGGAATVDIDVTALRPGLHYVTVRSQDNAGRWSPPVAHYFAIISPDEAGSHTLTRYEYWLDDDYAGARSGNLANGLATVDIDVTALRPGLHYVTVRAKNEAGSWSPPVAHYFAIISPDEAGSHTLTRYEYWLDDDYAGARSGNLANGLATVDIDVTALRPGLHYVTVRAKNEAGSWSPPVAHYFMLISADDASAKDVSACRYWIDGDNDNPVTSAVTAGMLNLDLDISSLKSGIHTITCLVQDDRGRWSVPTTCYFMVLGNEALHHALLVGYEYWFNSAPRIQVAVTPAQMLHMDDIVVPIKNVVPNKIAGYRFDVPSLTALVPDDVLFGLQVIDEDGNLSGARVDTIPMDVPLPVPLQLLKHRVPVTHAAPAAGTIQGYHVVNLGADCIVTVIVEGADVKADFFDGQGNQLEVTKTVQDGTTTYRLQPPAGNLYVLTYDAAGEASENTVEAIIDIHGDVNNDGEVSVADITLLVSLVMGGEADEDTRVRADVNLDGEISVADVTALVAIVMAQ